MVADTLPANCPRCHPRLSIPGPRFLLRRHTSRCLLLARAVPTVPAARFPIGSHHSQGHLAHCPVAASSWVGSTCRHLVGRPQRVRQQMEPRTRPPLSRVLEASIPTARTGAVPMAPAVRFPIGRLHSQGRRNNWSATTLAAEWPPLRHPPRSAPPRTPARQPRGAMVPVATPIAPATVRAVPMVPAAHRRRRGPSAQPMTTRTPASTRPLQQLRPRPRPRLGTSHAHSSQPPLAAGWLPAPRVTAPAPQAFAPAALAADLPQGQRAAAVPATPC